MKRHRTLHQQLGYGGLVLALCSAAGVLIWIVGTQGVAALGEGRARDAIVAGLICLAAVLVSVAALAGYLHWLSVTSRTAPVREMHIPSRYEDFLLGVGTLAVVIGSVAGVEFAYTGALAAVDDRRFGYAVGYGVLGVVVVAFAVFCVARYVRWMRE